jgi:hypothetical protein
MISLTGLNLDFMKENPLPEHRKTRRKQRPLSRRGLHVISDVMDPVVHPVTGQTYDSKSMFRAETRARGLTEVGNETIPDRVDRSLPSGLREDIGRAYDDLSSR